MGVGVQREVLNCVNRVKVIESEHCDTDVGLSAVKSACQSRNIKGRRSVDFGTA